MHDSEDRSGSPNLNRSFSLGRFSVENPVLLTIMMFAILALGIISTIRLPQEQFAEVPFYWVNVIVPYPGVGAQDLEASVTVPVENAFQGINKLKAISSTTSEGLSVVRVEFDDGISAEEFRSLFQDAQARFSQVRLPEGILDPVVDDFSSADFLPVVEVIVSGDQPYETLRADARKLRDRLLRIADVADVELVGARDREIRIAVDPTRLAALGMTTGEVLRAVGDQNQSIPGGTLLSGSREFLLRILGSVESVGDFGDIIVRRSSDSGGMVRVQDIAKVVDGFDNNAAKTRFNGEEAISLRVTKVPRGSSVGVVEGTRAILAEAEGDQSNLALSSGVSASIFNDSTVQISSSLSVLVSNAAVGLVLLVIILWIFVGLRNALITALGIPVTFALTFMVLEALGETINTNTLFGLVLVLGLIVDHGIVIVENSYRLQQTGLKRHLAAITGTDQVVWPVIAATATTVAAFLPLMLIPGTIGKFLRVIPLTVTIALIVSTFEALIFLPSHFADWGKEKPRKAGQREPGQWFDRIQSWYSRVITKAYKKRAVVLTVAVAIMAGSFALVGTLRQDLFAAEDFSYFSIDITMPTGTAIDRTDRIVRDFERILVPLVGQGEVAAIRSTSGTSGGVGSGSSGRSAQIIVDLLEQDEGRSRSIDAIIADIQSRAWNIAGTEQILYQKAQNGPPVSTALSYRVNGDILEDIQAVSRRLQDFLRSQDGVFNIVDDATPGSPELQIRLNSERASALGVSVASLGNFLRARFGGIPLGTWFENNEEVQVLLSFGETEGYDALEQSFIPTDDGRMVPFSSVAQVVPASSLGSIRRVDGKREITITADADGELDLRPVNTAVAALWADNLSAAYPGVSFSSGGSLGDFSNLLVEILRVFLLGIFLIYLILGAQFKSYSQPFLILLSIPFAFVGVILYLWASGTPFSTTVLYAGVALAGIAVNDAIVLISFVNELRAEGKSVAEAVTTAATTRLRPILLTSLTTIAGLLPTALGLGGVSVVWGPMASTILFGLVFSTLTALIIIPMLYGILYDKSSRDQRRATRLARKEIVNTSLNAESNAAGSTGTVTAKLASGPALPALLILAGLGLATLLNPSAAYAQRYPSMAATQIPAVNDSSAGTGTETNVSQDPDYQALRRFASEWQPLAAGPALSVQESAIRDILDRNASSLNALNTAIAIAQANLDRTRAFLLPGVALNPPDVASRSPLFSLSFAPASDSSGAFGATITTPETLTAQSGGGLSISQALPTAGTVRLTAGGSLSLASRDSEQTWGAGGFAGLSLDQPLFQGLGILRLDHTKNNLRKATLEVEGTMAARQSALQALSRQVLRLLTTKINLQESRWTLAEQAVLAEQSLAQIGRDLSGGAASQADLRRQLLASDALNQSVADLDSELAKLDSSLRSLGGAELLQLAAATPSPAVPPLAETISQLEAALRDNTKLAAWYAADDSWQTAWRALEQARLDTLLGTAADAPRLGLSFNLIPKASSGLDSAADAFKELVDPDKTSWQLSATFQASDLGLRTRKNTNAILAARNSQAA
ncbi:MAG: efflux RND transporter permease subunit, partial [Spirochaetes bacterium]|nr:efflux RND transporter permease subunit [Spirochaetota bacterium]